MNNKICLITGANAGIGKVTAIEMAKKGYTVVIVCRTREKAEEAVKDIINASGNKHVEYLVADLGSQKQVRKLAEDYLKKYDRLDVLVNNAGAFFSDYAETEDKIERQFAINHLASFLLTNLLLDVIKKSAPARIVNVASEGHYRGKINFEDLNHSKNYEGFLKAYCQTKLANVLFTYELARRLAGTGVTANCLHPGGVDTAIADKNSSGLYKYGWLFLRKFFLISVEDGAKTSIYLASSPDVEGVTGKYYDKCKPKVSSKLSYDTETARRLWEVSEKLVGLK